MVSDFMGATTLTPQAACLGVKSLIADLFFATNIIVGLSYTAIAGVLLFDRASATRTMFENRLAFGAFLILCAWSRLVATLMFYVQIYWLEAATMIATCVIAIIIAWLTLRTLKITHTAPS